MLNEDQITESQSKIRSDLPKFYQCGCCNAYHPLAWDGDCRDDANRFDIDGLDVRFGWDGWEEVEQPD